MLVSRSPCRKRLIIETIVAGSITVLAAGAPGWSLQEPASEQLWNELESIDAAASALATWKTVSGSPDLSTEAIEERATSLDSLRHRLVAIDTSDWSVSGRVDYLLVWARINALDFEHRVTRPWARDPIFYLNQFRRIPYAQAPLDEEARDRLAAVPAMVQQARHNLRDASGELAGLALFHLENFDGVGQGEPYRDEPPAGTIGWFEDLCARLAGGPPDDLHSCHAGLDAVRSYRDWLREKRPEMAPSAGIGSDQLNWYLSHVRLLPYDVDDLVLLGRREFERYRSAYEIVRNRNRALPELELTRSRDEHEQRTREAERRVRELIAEQDLLTIPEDMPAEFETDTFWSPRAVADRHFWEELQFRNALNNHIHASIPGHRFDGRLARGVENPIRRRYQDSSRAEGWATYIEEMFLLAGLTDEIPRAEELFYIALMKRASRIFAETRMHAGELSLDEANRYLIDSVPFMEPDLGRYDLEGYLRRPGSGSGYIIGKIQVEGLLAERALELGDDFELGAFHDDLLSRGMIPLTLIRWEMTGSDDEVRGVWAEITGREP